MCAENKCGNFSCTKKINEVFMVISKLSKADYAGKKFIARYMTKGYYDIQRVSNGFLFIYTEFDEEKEVSFEDSFFSEWLEEPVAYGAFEGRELVGFVEGTIEAWNNRYRISNICVFDNENKRSGIGSKLMETILSEAKQSGARMVIPETQTCNENAIAFYKKNGFEIIGFDLYSYSNDDPEKHEIRIEMGRKL